MLYAAVVHFDDIMSCFFGKINHFIVTEVLLLVLNNVVFNMIKTPDAYLNLSN